MFRRRDASLTLSAKGVGVIADIPQVSEYRAVIATATRDGSTRYSNFEERERLRKKPEARTSRQIADVASVMGIPASELTQRVEEALSLVMNELDRVRWELEISQQHEARLQALADAHSILPLLNRRAFFAQIVRLSEHAIRTGTEAILIHVRITNAGAITNEHGILVRDKALTAAAQTIVRSLREIDVAGEMGLGDFGIIQSLSDAASASEKWQEIVASLCSTTLQFDGIDIRLEVAMGLRVLDPALTPEEIVGDADISLRAS